MSWARDPYPPRLFSRESRRVKVRRDGAVFERIVSVIRRRPARETWAELLRRAA